MIPAWISQQPQRGMSTLQYWRGHLCPCVQPSSLCCLHLPSSPVLPRLALAVANYAPCLVGALSAHLYLPCIKVTVLSFTARLQSLAHVCCLCGKAAPAVLSLPCTAVPSEGWMPCSFRKVGFQIHVSTAFS